MKAGGDVKGSVVDGPGYNYVIFLQGCSHACPECHNKSTWSYTGGYDINVDDIYESAMEDIYTGITLSGGDPMDVVMYISSEEFNEFLSMLVKLKEKGLAVICYTGYYIKDLVCDRQKKLLALTDVLIDGPFEIDKKKELPFRGSENQNVLPLTEKGKNLLKVY